MTDIHFSSDELSELRDAFALFDKDGDGSISHREMADVMSGFGQELPADVLRPLFDDADKNSDGRLQWEEFVHMVQALDAQIEAHRALHRSLVIFLEIRGR